MRAEHAQDLVEGGDAGLDLLQTVLADAAELVREVAALLADPARRAQLRAAGAAFMAAHRGATDRLWNELSPSIGD